MNCLDLKMWTTIHNIPPYFEMVHLHSDCVTEEMHGSLMSEESIEDVLFGDVGRFGQT